MSAPVTRAQALMNLEKALDDLRRMDMVAETPKDRRTAELPRRATFVAVVVECRTGAADRRIRDRRARRGRQ